VAHDVEACALGDAGFVEGLAVELAEVVGGPGRAGPLFDSAPEVAGGGGFRCQAEDELGRLGLVGVGVAPWEGDLDGGVGGEGVDDEVREWDDAALSGWGLAWPEVEPPSLGADLLGGGLAQGVELLGDGDAFPEPVDGGYLEAGGWYLLALRASAAGQATGRQWIR
jgi:hypothetical protein